jgi:hypothetical protein
MKTFSPTDKLAIREKIWRATGEDPGSVHPDYFLSASCGGIKAGTSGHPARKDGSFEVYFLPPRSDSAAWPIEFNLN